MPPTSSMSSTTKGVLGALAGLALLATGIVVGVLVEKPAKAATPGSNLLQPITDKATVTYYQNGVAQSLIQQGNSPLIPGLTSTVYPVTAVDGDPANPAWVAALSIFQKYVNADAAAHGGFQNAPAGFPAQLRTDGVLDYATAIVLANS